MTRAIFASILWIAMAFGSAPIKAEVSPDLQLKITAAATWEREAKSIPSVVVALVDRDGITWSHAWGFSDSRRITPALPSDVYRVGSVSKLFTDLAIMRLVEQGKVDLDAPVTRYLPSFLPRNPFGGAITLRQLMTHRSGLVREPPRGNYFDTRAKGQPDTVLSLNETTLVARPGAVTKYSNAGIAVVGEVVARVTGKSYERAVRDLVLSPLGMHASSMSLAPVRAKLAYAEMASFDGARFAAPALELGTPAAGNLYTTLGDLARFVQSALNGWAIPGGTRLLKPATYAEMLRQQYPGDREPRIFGLGFMLGKVGGERSAGHGGQVYGFSTDVKYLPDAGIGAIVMSTVDAGNTPPKLVDYALSSWLAERAGKSVTAYPVSAPVTGVEAQRLIGWYTDGHSSVATRVLRDQLVLDGPEMAGAVRRSGKRYLVEDAQAYNESLSFAADASWLELDGVRYARAVQPEPPRPPAELASLIGEYGWDHNKLRMYQRDGQPFARLEYTDYRPLRRIGTDLYAFPTDRGLYRRETIRFKRDRGGNPLSAVISGIVFPRRDFGALAEAEIQGALVGNESSLRQAALTATPPAETNKLPSSLVALTGVDPSIQLDIKYARKDNLMGFALYDRPRAYMQRPAALALATVNRTLHTHGYGLLIRDAYRPWYVTKMFWDSTPDRFRMFPADPAKGSKHNRGSAVDLTLVSLTDGVTVEMPGRYDEYSDRSYSNYVGGSDRQRWIRDYLRSAMEEGGFTVFPEEWWHFDYQHWADYPIGNASFADLDRAAKN